MLSIIVPCYNEALNIPYIHRAFSECIGIREDIEVILINNGSTDNSQEIMNKLLRENKKEIFRIVHVKENCGYGFGILSGLKEAKGEVMAWTHADLQTDPSDVIAGYEKYLSLNDSKVFIKGKRTERQFHAWIFSLGMEIMASLALKSRLTEINAQPKVFSRDFYEKYLKDKAPNDFSLDLYAHYWAKRSGRIVEIPVVVKKRKFGEAKGGGSVRTKVKLAMRTSRYIFNFRNQLVSEKLIE